MPRRRIARVARFITVRCVSAMCAIVRAAFTDLGVLLGRVDRPISDHRVGAKAPKTLRAKPLCIGFSSQFPDYRCQRHVVTTLRQIALSHIMTSNTMGEILQ